jgi:NAD(P)-dependent dehydrogenase (short-subunit alcohol dehydrogenase family)
MEDCPLYVQQVKAEFKIVDRADRRGPVTDEAKTISRRIFMKDLKNKNVVVIGATGIIGKGAALAFAEAGAQVVVVSRSVDNANKAIAQFPKDLREKLFPLGALFSNAIEAKHAKESVEKLLGGGQKIDHVVVSVGNVDFAKAPSEDEFSKLLDAMNEAPKTLFYAAKAFLPEMKDTPGSSFLTVSGKIAYGCPVPPLWAASVKYGAINLLVSGFHSEFKNSQVRLNAIVPGTAVAEVVGGKNKIDMEAKIAARQLGDAFVALAQGTRNGEFVPVDSPEGLNAFLETERIK